MEGGVREALTRSNTAEGRRVAADMQQWANRRAQGEALEGTAACPLLHVASGTPVLVPGVLATRAGARLRSLRHSRGTMQTMAKRTYVWSMKWMKWTMDLVLVGITFTVPVAMLLVLLPGMALVRLLEHAGVLPPGAISPMPVLALAVFVGLLGAAWLVGRPAQQEAVDTAYPPEVPVPFANARLGEYDVPLVGSDVVYRTTLFGDQHLKVTAFVPADEYGPDSLIVTDADGIETTIDLPLMPGESITLTDEAQQRSAEEQS